MAFLQIENSFPPKNIWESQLWQLAQEKLSKFGYHNIFLFDCFSESVLEQISLDYFQKNYEGFSETYSILEDELSKQSMIAYLQGKIFNNFNGLATTCLANLNNQGGGILQ